MNGFISKMKCLMTQSYALGTPRTRAIRPKYVHGMIHANDFFLCNRLMIKPIKPTDPTHAMLLLLIYGRKVTLHSHIIRPTTTLESIKKWGAIKIGRAS